MNWREIVAIFVLIFVGIPLIVNLIIFASSIGVDNAETSGQDGVDLIQDAVTPWWKGLVDKLLEFGTPGAVVVIALFWVLRESNVF